MAIGIRHTGLVVNDLAASIAFYRDILGLKEVMTDVESGEFIDNIVALDGVELKYCKLVCRDGGMLELIQYLSHPYPASDGPSPSNKIGCSHVCYTVENLDLLHQKLTEQGFNCNCKPQIFPNGKVKGLYCHDPDGIIVELIEEID